MPDDARALARLRATVPPWFAFPSCDVGSLKGWVVLSDTVWAEGALDLTVRPAGGGARAKETSPSRLPSWCPELHLNSDATFCTAYRAMRVGDEADARQWWADLEVHLRLLSTALRTGVWPAHSSLDHGAAAKHQIAAFALARRLGLEEDLRDAGAGADNWLADLDCGYVGKDGRMVRGPDPCPCGLGRGGHERRRCDRASDLVHLVLLERARRLTLQRFWECARGNGAVCCGAMRDCPLSSSSMAKADEGLLRQTLIALQRSGKRRIDLRVEA